MLSEQIPLLGQLNFLSVLVRLLLAVLLGGLIGIDRERKHRPAGLRTYMLVSLGAALVMLTSQYMLLSGASTDPARLGAQVISGIGFLGAGTILVTHRNHVQGLTTAAGLWCSACIGLAVGIGFYEGAAVTCLMEFFVMGILYRLDHRTVSDACVMEIYVEMACGVPLSALLSCMASRHIRVISMEIVPGTQTAGIAARMTLQLPNKCDHSDLLDALRQANDVFYMNEI